MYGDVCALTGPTPRQVLDAAHLYSYAELGEHDDMGGLLIRKALHRLFDLGLILINPSSLQLQVDKVICQYPHYQLLHNKSVQVELEPKTVQWIQLHWKFHTQ